MTNIKNENCIIVAIDYTNICQCDVKYRDSPRFLGVTNVTIGSTKQYYN